MSRSLLILDVVLQNGMIRAGVDLGGMASSGNRHQRFPSRKLNPVDCGARFEVREWLHRDRALSGAKALSLTTLVAP